MWLKSKGIFDERLQRDLLRVCGLLIVGLWGLLSFVPWVDLAYGDRPLWLSWLFAGSGIFTVFGLYVTSLLLAKGEGRGAVRKAWMERSIYVVGYAIVWILAFSFA